MVRRRWLPSVLAIVLFLSASTTGMLGSASAQDAGDRPVLRFGVNAADLATLDPHFASGTQDRTVVDMVFNGLVRFQAGRCLEYRTRSRDRDSRAGDGGWKQAWTFTLRDDVMCHPWDGRRGLLPLTADDVVYSLQKSANADSSALCGDYAGMTVAKVDDETVNDHAGHPALADALPAEGRQLQRRLHRLRARPSRRLGDDGSRPTRSAPAVHVRVLHAADQLVLVANDDYFRGAPKLPASRFATCRMPPAASWPCRPESWMPRPVSTKRSGSIGSTPKAT